jgi:Zn finger protein HypA/HybF involved in hydrogenase expression
MWMSFTCEQCGQPYKGQHNRTNKLCPACQPAVPVPAVQPEPTVTEPKGRMLRNCPRCRVAFDPAEHKRGCPTCNKEKDRGRSKDNAWRDHARFKNARKFHLARHPICVWCERVPATDIHHVSNDPALRYTYSNFRGLCHSCHSIITRRGGGEIPSEAPADR